MVKNYILSYKYLANGEKNFPHEPIRLFLLWLFIKTSQFFNLKKPRVINLC